MLLSQKAIQEFKEVYKKEYGEELSDKEAEIMAQKFMEFVFMLSHSPGDDIN